MPPIYSGDSPAIALPNRGQCSFWGVLQTGLGWWALGMDSMHLTLDTCKSWHSMDLTLAGHHEIWELDLILHGLDLSATTFQHYLGDFRAREIWKGTTKCPCNRWTTAWGRTWRMPRRQMFWSVPHGGCSVPSKEKQLGMPDRAQESLSHSVHYFELLELWNLLKCQILGRLLALLALLEPLKDVNVVAVPFPALDPVHHQQIKPMNHGLMPFRLIIQPMEDQSINRSFSYPKRWGCPITRFVNYHRVQSTQFCRNNALK